MDPQTLIESARQDHPELVAEYERLHAWVATCLGQDVAAWNGLPLDWDPSEVGAQ